MPSLRQEATGRQAVSLSYKFLEAFGIPVQVGSMFTIATHLIEIIALDDDKQRATIAAYERCDNGPAWD